jgi:plasmid stabilization system protein ParE
MKPRIHPQAQRDQRRHFEYLRKAEVGSATLQKYFHAIRDAAQKIADNPETWSFAPGSERVRRVQVPAFRMQVFYILLPNGTPFILEICGPGSPPRWSERL